MMGATLLISVSCDEETPEPVDTSKPVISNVQHPEVVRTGEIFELGFQLEDDLALGEVRINIHSDFDGHAHERISLEATPFSYDNILEEMEGELTFTIQEEILIPEAAASGEYHLQILYLDAAGNEGDLFVSSFVIESEHAPLIQITNFEEEDDLELNENGFLMLEGYVESQTEGGLEQVHIMITEEGEGDSHSRTKHDGEHVYEEEWELNGATLFVFEEAIETGIDLSAAEAGHYLLTIQAVDVEGNMKTLKREVHVN